MIFITEINYEPKGGVYTVDHSLLASLYLPGLLAVRNLTADFEHQFDANIGLMANSKSDQIKDGNMYSIYDCDELRGMFYIYENWKGRQFVFVPLKDVAVEIINDLDHKTKPIGSN